MSAKRLRALRYYRERVELAHLASKLQRQRCAGKTQPDPGDPVHAIGMQFSRDGTKSRGWGRIEQIDLSFYINSVQRIREAAKQASNYQVTDVLAPVYTFDSFYPAFRTLRNLDEHALGPTPKAYPGLTNFGNFLTNLRLDKLGTVDYLVDTRYDEDAVDTMVGGILAALDVAIETEEKAKRPPFQKKAAQ